MSPQNLLVVIFYRLVCKTIFDVCTQLTFVTHAHTHTHMYMHKRARVRIVNYSDSDQIMRLETPVESRNILMMIRRGNILTAYARSRKGMKWNIQWTSATGALTLKVVTAIAISKMCTYFYIAYMLLSRRYALERILWNSYVHQIRLNSERRFQKCNS
jgi:hypothetical protein